jgi:membrane-bound inhibitor of C-type lysozyme
MTSPREAHAVFNPVQFRNLALCLMLLPLAACVDDDEGSRTPSRLIVPPMMNTRPATFECDDTGIIVLRPLGEDGRTITLALTNREIQLKATDAPEGQKYTDGKTVFWMNRDNATLSLDGKAEAESCERK